MCKGADSVLLPLIKDSESPSVSYLINKTVNFMNGYAKEGLRTLLIVQKTLTEEEYAFWSAQYTQALSSLSDRDA